ncbi:hypothetical protein [Bacillus sp. EB600]|uniref:hypothetical protein n=1 Tax=Bacillus sp. EB600 TaxID=2806345 RepID=UPI00210C9E69|nr:hypothetical protein [Bacillus sp. EB600]MCQ6277880.1 hypothetical protein [Bacillus sp. EB600]
MNEPTTEKEQLFIMFSEMNEQLADLESVLRTSFSDLRKEIVREEVTRLAVPDKRIAILEQRYIKSEIENNEELTNYPIGKNQSVGLKFELGFKKTLQYD